VDDEKSSTPIKISEILKMQESIYQMMEGEALEFNSIGSGETHENALRVVCNIRKDAEIIDIPPGAAIVPGPEKPNLCKRVEEFRCRASNELPMEKCRYFAQNGTAWYCASRAYDDFQCLNPTAKAEVLMDDVRTVDNLQARINELEAKWEGANLEAHGLLKLFYKLIKGWDNTDAEGDKMVSLMTTAAKKFGWENENESNN
jgi:hypothetical protein